MATSALCFIQCIGLCCDSCRTSLSLIFFFQAEDGIRDLVRSRGLGDVYKRQGLDLVRAQILIAQGHRLHSLEVGMPAQNQVPRNGLSLIHI